RLYKVRNGVRKWDIPRRTEHTLQAKRVGDCLEDSRLSSRVVSSEYYKAIGKRQLQPPRALRCSDAQLERSNSQTHDSLTRAIVSVTHFSVTLPPSAFRNVFSL